MPAPRCSRGLLLRLLALGGLVLLASAFRGPAALSSQRQQGRRQRCRVMAAQQGQQPDGVSRSDLMKRATLFAQIAAGAFVLGGQQEGAWAADEAAAPAAAAAGAAEGAGADAAAPAAPPKPVKTAYDYAVPYNGERVPLSKYKGKAVIVCNPKSDDPEALNQMPALAYLNGKYYKDGLKIWCFTTEQGTFETDEDRVIRIKYYQQYGFGQYPNAVVFDKIDIVGKRADPFYKFLCLTLKNPNKIARITLNFEKFLLNAEGRPIRRYPRRYSGYDMEEDVKAVLAGEPLPPPSPKLIKAWRDAFVEAERSEYAFKKGLNYYEPLGEDMRNLP